MPSSTRFHFLRRVLLRAAPLLLPALFAPARAQGPVPTGLADLAAAYSNSVSRIDAESGKERDKLLAQTAVGLKALEDNLAAQGKLNALVQCQQAAKRVAEGGLDWQLAAPDPEIAAAQKSVLASQSRLDLARRQRLDLLHRQYLGQLDQMKLTLTRQKKVEEALAVQAEAERVRGLLAAKPAGAPVAPRAPGGRPANPPGQIWASFEQEKDLKEWEVRQGPPPERTDQHATDGTRALRARAGNLLVCETIPRDWSAAKTLAFDVFYTGEKPLALEIVLGDQAWLDKLSYWNRHNRFLEIKPGARTVSIPLSDLYRGEENKKGSDLKGELDRKQMRFLSIQCGPAGAGGELHLDAFRLER